VIDTAVANIVSAPQRWPVKGRWRRYYLRRFPYMVAYREAGALIEIGAVAHQHRRPDYWFRRRWRPSRGAAFALRATAGPALGFRDKDHRQGDAAWDPRGRSDRTLRVLLRSQASENRRLRDRRRDMSDS